MASDDALLDQVKFSNPLATTSMDDEGDVSPPRHQSRPTLGPMPENALMNLSLDVMQGMKSLDPQAKALMGTDEARERRDLDALNYMDANKIISPDSEFRHHWDLVQVPLLIYVAIAIPYRIGFSHDTNPWEFGFVVDIFVDLFFIIDIFLSFRTAVWNKHGEITYEPAGIAHAYFRGWFVIDVLGCLPINYVLLFMRTWTDSSAGRGNKVFRVLRLFKLLKLLRLARLKRIVARYEEEFYGLASGFALGKIVIVVLMIGHWLACLWFGIGDIADETALTPSGDARLLAWTEIEWGEYVCASNASIAVAGAYLPYDESAADPCADSLPCSVECAVNRRSCSAVGVCTDQPDSVDAGQRWERYVTSLYWAFMTMTTVGYGDIPAATFLEKYTAVLGMLIGGFTFGLIVGALGEIARKSNPGENFRTKKIGHISAYLSRRGVTPDLVRRIRHYFQNHYETSSVFAEKEFSDYFMRLPSEHRISLAAEIGYLTSEKTPGMMGQVPIFSDLDTVSMIMICGKLKTKIYAKSMQGGDTHREPIVRRGEVAQDMIVMLYGRMNRTTSQQEPEIKEFLQHDNNTAREWDDILETGKCLDDHVCVLPSYMLHHRTTTGYAQTDCGIGLLSADDVGHLRVLRPQLDNHLVPMTVKARADMTRRKVKDIFRAIDSDGSGEIDISEFGDVMVLMGKELDETDLRDMFNEIDEDGGGSIDADEFCDWFLEEEELNKGKTARTVGVGPNSPRLSERSPRASKDDSEFGLDGDTTAMLSAGGEEVSMATLRADFIELDRIASKMQKDFEKVMKTVAKKMPTTDDE